MMLSVVMVSTPCDSEQMMQDSCHQFMGLK